MEKRKIWNHTSQTSNTEEKERVSILDTEAEQHWYVLIENWYKKFTIRRTIRKRKRISQEVSNKLPLYSERTRSGNDPWVEKTSQNPSAKELFSTSIERWLTATNYCW